MARQQAIGRKESIMGMLRGQSQQAQPVFFPAPAGGLNRTDALALLPPTDAYILTNFVGNTQGIGVRPGFVNHSINIGGSITTDIRTVASFNDVSRDNTLARDKLFAFTDQGIYDVTAGPNNPTLMPIYDGIGGATILSTGWVTKGSVAGWVSWVNFTTAATTNGKHYLLACDLLNGYHVYDPDGGGAGIGRWYKVKEGNSGGTAIEGIDPTKFVHVCAWKGRVIFSEVDSSRAWYLTPGTIAGTGASKPVAIDMGSRFIYGGFLKGCFTWTYDGGAGIDDFLVAISSAGDVVVWQGISPADTSFQIKGVWYVGEPPIGRRICTDSGGDLVVVGALGAIPLSSLVQGGREGEQKYITYKIMPLVRQLFRQSAREFGWAIQTVPYFDGLILNVPPINGVYTQLFMSYTTKAWSVLTGLASLDFVEHKGDIYFGTVDGRVCKMGGSFDTTQVAANTFTEDPIGWQLLTSYQSFDTPALWKQAQIIRPVWLSEQLPTYNISARYDFDITVPQPVDPPPTQSGSIWDLALWDVNIWGGSFTSDQPTVGATGIGRWVAIALSGRSSTPTNLVGFNVIYKPGGML